MASKLAPISKTPSFHSWRRRSVYSRRTALGIAIIVACLGILFMWRSFAATPLASPDINGDGKVTLTDLSILLSGYGKTTAQGDLNGDGTVNLSDLSILLSNFGKTIDLTPTPPPPAGGGLACGSASAGGATVPVSSTGQFSSALASAKAGDTIVVTGSYPGSISISGKTYSGAPLTIKAATRLGTTLNSIQITDSNNIVIEGFRFGPNTASTLVKIANSTNVKILRNSFDHKDITAGQSTIVTSGASQAIEIGCNEFLNKNISQIGTAKITGSYIKTQFDPPNMTKNLHVYKNYFKGITPFLVNGVPAGDSDREAIAMGIAGSQSIITNNIVESNLFEECDGENEIITVKTSNNIFRGNTFKNSMGSLSFRLGNNSEAYDNYFYGVGASAVPADSNYQTGGIRIYGTGHTLLNNVMKDLTGISYRLPILLDSGDTSNSVGGDSHQVATNNRVTGNTILNSAGGIHIGSGNYGIKPSGNTVTGNTASGSIGILFNDLGATNTWTGNKAYATGSAAATGGVTRATPEVQILTAAPSVTLPTPLTSSDVGPNGP